jgi:DUF971 family protein
VNKKLTLPIVGQPDPNSPGDVHLVGRYAVGVTWADAHGSIYPFERLRRACPCGACAEAETLTPAMGWPRDIQKQPGGLSVTWTDAHQSFYPYQDLRAACQCAACTGGH